MVLPWKLIHLFCGFHIFPEFPGEISLQLFCALKTKRNFEEKKISRIFFLEQKGIQKYEGRNRLQQKPVNFF